MLYVNVISKSASGNQCKITTNSAKKCVNDYVEQRKNKTKKQSN